MNGAIKPEMFVLVVFLIPVIAGGILAANRARNILGWGILCGIFPIFLMVLYFKKPLREVEGRFRLCPKCGEFYKWREPSCKYCDNPLPLRKGPPE